MGGRGDALVMCPAEGDSLGAAKDLAAGLDSLPPGIKTENILPLMASDSRLNYIGVLKEHCYQCEGGLLNRFHKRQEKKRGNGVTYMHVGGCATLSCEVSSFPPSMGMMMMIPTALDCYLFDHHEVLV